MPEDTPTMARGLKATQAIAERVRKQVQALAKRNPGAAVGALVDKARKIVAKHEPLFARTIRDSLLASWLDAARTTLPPWLPPPTPPAPGATPPIVPPTGTGPTFPGMPDDPEPVVRLPMIEAAAKDLRERGVMLPADFAALDQDARRTAFTVARVSSIDTIEKVRIALVDTVQEGRTLREFRGSVGAALEASSLGKHHVEGIFRTSVMQAYSAGQKDVLGNPFVADQFPYLLFVATHDTRVRSNHLAMEKHGQNRSAVYRTDDPIWLTAYPPISYNCRCAVIPLSIADAAAHGSREAQRWLRTGIPPTNPEFARLPYPVTPPRGWPTHDKIASVV